MTDTETPLFVVKRNSKVGRYAVARESIKAGQLIFCETPFVYGPKSDTPVVCLGCYTPVDCTTLCSQCKWPVCSQECENKDCHTLNECQIFKNANIAFCKIDDPQQICVQYEPITPLRMLLTIEKNQNQWDTQVSLMESHNEIRKQKEIWEYNQKHIVNFIRDSCNFKNKFTDEIIHTVCGILEINSFEASTPTGNTFRCLFPKFGVMSHNCISNMHHSIDCCANGKTDDCKIYIRATVDIKKDDELYVNYVYSLWPTLVRRQHMRESKFFDCDCQRCSDPSELGTHSSSLKCQKCQDGVVMSTKPLDDFCDWKCNVCDYKTNATSVRKIFNIIQSDIDKLEYITDRRAIQLREALYKKYECVLHPNNAYMTILRFSLSQLYGKTENYYFDDLSDDILERKIEICKKLLEVLDVIEPGLTRIRGMTFYELHAPLMQLSRHQYQNDEISKKEFRKKLKTSVDLLKKSAEILKNEPESQPEGQLGRMLEVTHAQLEQNFELLVNTA